ncbi:MFS transporter [Streptomyces sp. NBC_01551]|uniref:MFS transporter n=1 Tax=Streptomyces sp. NBC_01551 TaxID=2975876 RepID=UPI002254582B|nr:MFS transporter [Streptomyces sp. NBC_01551]MCX4526923.1 MFS transporter [Streptomyces sp. NBC_01551]
MQSDAAVAAAPREDLLPDAPEPGSPDPGSPDPGRPPRRSLAFAVLASVQFTLILAMSVLNVVLPEVQRDLGLDSAQLAMINAAYGVSFSGLLLLGGRLSDLYGARRAFVTGTAVFGVASAAAGLAPEVWTLLVARFAQGAGAALAVPAAVALVGITYPEPARQARLMALWGGLAAFGGTAGMLLSGVVAATDSWRWAFVVPVLVAAVAAGSAGRLLPAGEPTERRGQLDVPGTVLVTAGISLLSYGLVEAPERGWTSPGALGPLVCGIVLLALFVRVEMRAARPILPLSFLASPRRGVALAAVFLGSAGITAIFFMLSLYFQQVRGYSGSEAAAAFLPFGLALVATGSVVGRLVQRFGPRTVMLTGLGLSAVGLALLSGIGPDTAYAGLILAGLLFFAAGVAMVFAGSTVSAMADVAPGQAGMAGAVTNTALEAGPALGLSVLVTLAAARTRSLGESGAADLASGYGFAFALAAGAFALTALLATLLFRSRRA